MASLFVYGTLAPGERNSHVMDGMDGTWQKASVRGQRFDQGWGIGNRAPGFFPDPDGPVVHGLLFISTDLPDHWPRLDAFEGSDYERVEIEATLESGEIVTSCIYRAIPKD